MATSVQQIVENAQKQNRKCFPYISRGKLNMICLRHDREVTQIDTSTQDFLTNASIVRGQSLDAINFVPNAIFKVTIDFKESKETINFGDGERTSLRETTDWLLTGCSGQFAFYDKNVQRLVLQRCASVTSCIADMQAPLTIILKFDEDEWVAERVFGQ